MFDSVFEAVKAHYLAGKIRREEYHGKEQFPNG